MRAGSSVVRGAQMTLLAGLRDLAFDRPIGQLPLALRAFLMQGDLRVLQGDHLAMAHLTIAPVEEAHRLAEIHVRAHGEDASGIGQHTLDDGAQLEELPARRPAERIDRFGWVPCLFTASSSLRCRVASKRPGTRSSGGSLLRGLFDVLQPTDVPRQQLVDAIDRMVRDAPEHIAQVGPRGRLQ